jgi:RNA polymerase sigma-70 factor, ECF subfamily
VELNLKEMSDYAIVRLCLDENENYFSEIVSRYKNLVYHVVLKMVNNNEEANDLAQEVFIKIYTNLHKYVPDFKLSTWIITISTNHVIDFRRKKRLQTVDIEAMHGNFITDTTPEDIFIQGERKDFLDSLLDSLPTMYKTPILLYHKEGLSYQEISNIIEEPLSKVKNRIFRGRKLLKENLIIAKDGDYCEL